MTQENFKEILDRYLNGSCSKDEKERVERWYETLNKSDSFILRNEEELENSLLTSLQKRISQTTPVSKPAQIIYPWRWMTAAVITIAIISVVYLVEREDSLKLTSGNEPKEYGRLREVNNTSLADRQVSLPDGSFITLKQGSSIQYDSSFSSEKREVYLEGEAFFDVHRDVTRPFFVYSHDVVTKVLGTSFTITAFGKDDDVTVKVKTGKVLVYTIETNPSGNKTSVENTLTPNQQIIFNRSESNAARSLVEQPEVILPIEEVQRMRFEEAPVTEILKALEKIYGMEIEFDEATFATCTLTTSISDGGIFNRLDIICNAIGATYTVEGTQIKLNGSGCK